MLTFVYIGILLILDLKGGDFNGKAKNRAGSSISALGTPRIAFMEWYAETRASPVVSVHI